MTGLWIAASYVLGRDVSTDEPYPHLCGRVVDGRMTHGLRVLLEPENCAACGQRRFEAKRRREGGGHVPNHHR